MTKDEKGLLFKDLCARLPYDVLFLDTDKDEGHLTGIEDADAFSFYGYIYQDKEGFSTTLNIDEFKVYLRPMSSMTEEETDEYDRLVMCNASWVVDDWLNAHNFDYRKLIEKGLALEAPEDIYKN